MTNEAFSSKLARPHPAFWAGKSVLLTGHTGFKGSWAALWLNKLGASVTGAALPSEQSDDLFSLARIGELVDSRLIDIRDRDAVAKVAMSKPFDVVLHLAAQPIVRTSIEDPIGTLATNVLGTAHLLDALRGQTSLRTILVVTTDKVYANSENGRSFVEGDPLGGKDPYAASKAATEIVAASFGRSYFDRLGIRVATARGGNVIGGGDVSRDRLVADLIRAVQAGEAPRLRHPEATRPWQHVLDCLAGYLVYAERLCDQADVPRVMNFGPRPGSAPVSVGAVADAALGLTGWTHGWVHEPDPTSIEAGTLSVDARLARDTLGFESAIDCVDAVTWTMKWHEAVRAGGDARFVTLNQIEHYEGLR